MDDMGRVNRLRRPLNRRVAMMILAVGCAALAAWLPSGRGAAEGPASGGPRAANAEVMIITRGALEGALSPSG